jgi:hypothetical protein
MALEATNPAGLLQAGDPEVRPEDGLVLAGGRTLVLYRFSPEPSHAFHKSATGR